MLSGEGTADGEPFKAGDSFFIPCGEAFAFAGKAKIILADEPENK